MPASSKRVFIVGLDGGSFDLIGPWTKEGRLPHMSSLMERGFGGHLETVFPPITPTAWASFITGKNPGKHGIMDFDLSLRNVYDRTVVNATNIDGPTLWSILSSAGRKICVVHVPLTYPPETIDGVVVSGYALSPSISTHPKELVDDLLRRFPEYKKIHSDISLIAYVPKEEEDAYIRNLHLATKTEAEIVYYLMEENEWQFFIAHFYFLDQIQHNLWKYTDPNHPAYRTERAKRYGDAILEHYKLLDSIIGEIMSRVGSDTDLLVMSDHGFGPLYKRVFINHWLEKIGMLKMRKKRASLRGKLLSRLGMERDKIINVTAKSSILGTFSAVVPRSLARLVYWNLPLSTPTMKNIDFSQTRAYSTGCAGQIFINLKGRDPEGIVEPEDFEKVRGYIMGELQNLKDPKGGKLVDRVWTREEIYSGPHADKAADIFFIMENLSYITLGSVYRPWEFGKDLNILFDSPKHLSGWHRMNGVLMGAGPSIKKGATAGNARIIDLAPTVLHMMGLSIPAGMDGRVLNEVLNVEYSMTCRKKEAKLSKSTVEHDLTEEEKAVMREKLKALGYL